MRLRLVVPPLLVALVGAGIWAASREGATPASRDGRPAPGAAATVHGKDERPWHPEPVRTAEVPRAEEVPAVVRAPKAVELTTRVRHTPVKEVRKHVGEAVKKGEVVLVLQAGPWEKELAAAEKAGDAARIAAAKEALANLEVRAEEDGILHRVDASIGEVPIPGRDGRSLPLAYLFDWKALSWEGTAPKELASFLAEGAPLLVSSGKDPPVPAFVVTRGAPAADGGIALVLRPASPPAGVPEPGGKATIHVVTGKKEVTVVPKAAVRLESGRSFVDVVPVEGKPEPREVVVGLAAPEGRVAVSGVRVGESVVVPE